MIIFFIAIIILNIYCLNIVWIVFIFGNMSGMSISHKFDISFKMYYDGSEIHFGEFSWIWNKTIQVISIIIDWYDCTILCCGIAIMEIFDFFINWCLYINGISSKCFLLLIDNISIIFMINVKFIIIEYFLVTHEFYCGSGDWFNNEFFIMRGIIISLSFILSFGGCNSNKISLLPFAWDILVNSNWCIISLCNGSKSNFGYFGGISKYHKFTGVEYKFITNINITIKGKYEFFLLCLKILGIDNPCINLCISKTSECKFEFFGKCFIRFTNCKCSSFDIDTLIYI